MTGDLLVTLFLFATAAVAYWLGHNAGQRKGWADAQSDADVRVRTAWTQGHRTGHAEGYAACQMQADASATVVLAPETPWVERGQSWN